MASFIQHFTWLDYSILIVLAISIFVSFYRGFIKEMISLITWVLSIVLAFKCAPLISPILFGWISRPGLQYILSFCLILGVMLIVGILINRLMKTMVLLTGMSLVDRGLGVVFGFLKGALVVTMILLLINVTALQSSSWFVESSIAPWFNVPIQIAQDYIPKKLKHLSVWIKQPATQAELAQHPIAKQLLKNTA